MSTHSVCGKSECLSEVLTGTQGLNTSQKQTNVQVAVLKVSIMLHLVTAMVTLAIPEAVERELQ